MSDHIRKIFVDWTKPCLPEVAAHLLSEYTKESTLDLSRLTVVFQVSRAGRRLLEILALECEAKGLLLVPPRVITVGGFPEAVLTLPQVPASEAECLAGWAEALRNFDTERLRPVIAEPPSEEDFLSWLKLSRRLYSVYSELSAACLSFDDVVKSIAKLPEFVDEERWMVLAEVRQGYLEVMSRAGLCDRHELRASAVKTAAQFEGEILLVAAFDLNQLSRKILAELRCKVTAVIHAPQSEETAFDDQGCLIRERWESRNIDIKDESMVMVRGPEEHARAVVEAIARAAKGCAAEEVVIGALQQPLVPYLREALKEAGVGTRYAGGLPIGAASPFLLLKLLAAYLSSGAYFDFATLLRHGDVQRWLCSVDPNLSTNGMLEASDRFQAERLRAGFSLRDVAEGIVGPMGAEAIEAALKELSGNTPLKEWAFRIANFLTKVYAGRNLLRHLPEDRVILESLELIRDRLDECFEIPAALQISLSGYEAIQIVLFLLRGASIPPEQKESAVEILGWLELQLDDSAALVISGVNERSLPESVNEDIFLPNALRSALGLLDNTARYVRDVYALTALLACRPRAVMIASRTDARGDDLMLSRLLLACDERTMARRLLQFSKISESPRALQTTSASGNSDGFRAARRPNPLPDPVETVSVTALKTYLECPYRFYLRHVLRLEDLDDRGTEMDGGLFGDLIHQVLYDFGTSSLCASCDRDEIEVFLARALESRFAARHGKSPLPAVLIQKHQLLERLKYFAEWQASWSASGWVIRECEHDFKGQDFAVRCSNGMLAVRGRIDRIDYNPNTNEWLIIDYKTGEAQDDLRKSHLMKDEWRDLQLPVYQFYYEGKQPESDIRTAYLLLNGSGSLPDLQWADWTDDELASARQCLEQTAQRIRAGEFWPPKELRKSFDAFTGILGTGCLGAEAVWEE